MISSTQCKTQPVLLWPSQSNKGTLLQVPSHVPSPWWPYHPDNDRNAISSESTMTSQLCYFGTFLKLPIPLSWLGTLCLQSSGKRWWDSSKSPSPLWIYSTRHWFFPLEYVLIQPESNSLPYNSCTTIVQVGTSCLAGWYHNFWDSQLSKTKDAFYALEVAWQNLYCKNDHSTKINLQIQFNPSQKPGQKLMAGKP